MQQESHHIKKSILCKGHNKQENEIYMHCFSGAIQNVIFFPGDVQNYRNQMTSGYEEYCYESTVEILKKKFKHSNVLIVCPVRMHKETYSCFDHFIPPSMSTKHGAVRTYASDGKAIEHLMCLLHSCQHYLNEQPELVHFLVDDPLILVGFSKGCEVLNQLVTELAQAPLCTAPHCASTLHNTQQNSECECSREAIIHPSSFLFRRISDLIWLDSGNGSLPQCFPIAAQALTKLAKFKIRVHVFGTPYQLASTARPWIAPEMETFCTQLQELQMNVHHEILFENELGSLAHHFGLLDSFTIKDVLAADCKKMEQIY